MSQALASTPGAIMEEVRRIFAETLSVTVDSPDTDLLDEGIIDSLMLINLMAALDEAFQVDLLERDFDIDSFRSIRSIADFIAAERSAEAAE